MHRFFCKTTGSPGEEAALSSAEQKHLFKILRAVPGDQVELLDGNGKVTSAEVSSGKALKIVSVKQHSKPKPDLYLFVAPPKRQKMDQLLRQCSEVGIGHIHPILTKRSVSSPDKISERWITLLQEGCKQSGNPFLPHIGAPMSFNNFLKMTKEQNISAFFGAIRGETPSPENITGDIAWIVGPEGGFTEEEEDQMLTAGVKPLRLGSYVLRVETAVICGASLLNFLSNRGD
ncbi:MAG: 16S rRNA (uracil(1498)-N(3))-methyltransferase [Lentisphaerae bacterium]|nr:16S rRNA (uracil(1498)-N(3))-methyltransferase [Lentisphaerota bacterium]MCP4101140.1 16S rRNA (uracil(1498)-N(3))-methyltransferase [Lentisphaerota bacterium]